MTLNFLSSQDSKIIFQTYFFFQMRFRQVNITKTNITSSLDLQDSYQRFGLITRELSLKSSKYQYQLQIYDFNKMQKKGSIKVYQSYGELKHFLRFVADMNLVAATTKFEINFYTIEPLKLKHSYPHNQISLYDLQASPDGELVVLVGQFIKIWRTNGFRETTFPHVIASARYCSFSKDNKYMVIASVNEINVYVFSKFSGDYIFNQLKSVQVPVENDDITSIDFDPTNSNRMVVGFLGVSPQYFQIDTGFFIPQRDIQPQDKGNAKKANFLPDGKRFLSSDYRNGVGIWNGIDEKLFYKEGYLLYDLHSNVNGSRFIGYVWKQVKVVQIDIQCKISGKDKVQDKNYYPSCPCETGYRWDFASYSCQPLVCLTSQFATGQEKNNQCVCQPGYVFYYATGKCILDCTRINHAIQINYPSNSFCYCKDKYRWDGDTKTCIFDCQLTDFSTGALIAQETCQCLVGFQWNSQYKQCVCPQYRRVLGSGCMCYDQYFEDQSGKCILDCSPITNSIGTKSSQQQCECIIGYTFTIITEAQTQKVGCKLDCSKFNNTRALSSGFDTCQCQQNMNWKDKMCMIDCSKVQYGSASSTGENACKCAVNYIWIQQIFECGKNCTSVANINQTRKSTLKSCPCINNFNWDETSSSCVVDCTKINNTFPYSLANPVECECRSNFEWIKNQYLCRINCDLVWDSKDRKSDYECNCNGGKNFNTTKLTCQALAQDSLFSNAWTIVGLVVSILIFLIIVIVLVKYCWRFRTKNNREHDKRLKTTDVPLQPKKKKLKKELLQNNKGISDEQINTITTI